MGQYQEDKMAKSERQKLKLCYLIEFFKRKTDVEHPATISDIIDHLAEYGILAERKSIYRDIAAMEELGYEIVSVHNKKFSYYLGSRDFETAELRLLVDAVQASRFITGKKSNDLIKKLESLATEYDEKKLNSQVYVTNRIKSSNESIYYNVDSIHCAIQENKRIIFKYFDWDVTKHRIYRKSGGIYEVSPWALIWHNENYYLIGFDSAEGIIKHYRVDRMTAIDMTDTERDGAEDFKELDVALYVKKFFGMYNGEIVSVTLRCSNEITNSVIDMFGSNVDFKTNEGEDTFDVTAEVALTPVFLSWVFMFGGKVRIIEPSEAAARLKEMAKAVLEQ